MLCVRTKYFACEFSSGMVVDQNLLTTEISHSTVAVCL